MAETDNKDKSINEAAAVGKPKTSMQSAVTTDLPSPEIDTGNVELSEADEAHLATVNLDPFTRANDAGIGLIETHDGSFQYVGVAPARDKNPETPEGFKVTPSRATFTPLEAVPFHNSFRVKDPKSGKFYYPPDGCTSWADCNLEGSYLIPKEADKAAVAARRQGKIEALARG